MSAERADVPLPEGGESRYTLAEAQRELARQECKVHGHSFDVVQEVGKGPVEIICSNGCGGSWDVSDRIFDADRLAKCVDAQPTLDFTFRGWPGKLTVQAALTDSRGREQTFAVPVAVEHRDGEPVLTLDLERLTADVYKQFDAGTFGP